MANAGKQFENDLKKSVPGNVFYYRFRDGTGAWGEGEKTRFQATNICDCLLFDGKKLLLLELKSHKGKSVPFTAVRQNQVEGLSKAASYENIVPGMVFNFRDESETYFVPIRHVEYYIAHSERKSFPLNFIREYGIRIWQQRLRTHYRYDVLRFLQEVSP